MKNIISYLCITVHNSQFWTQRGFTSKKKKKSSCLSHCVMNIWYEFWVVKIGRLVIGNLNGLEAIPLKNKCKSVFNSNQLVNWPILPDLNRFWMTMTRVGEDGAVRVTTGAGRELAGAWQGGGPGDWAGPTAIARLAAVVAALGRENRGEEIASGILVIKSWHNFNSCQK